MGGGVCRCGYSAAGSVEYDANSADDILTKIEKMIPDKIFKALLHSYKGYEKHFSGESLEEGYRPDYVLKKGNSYLILESENATSRKTFVGGMMKAAHFLQGSKRGKLVFIIVPKSNTTAVAIARHLKKYLSWIKGISNLRDVYVIEAVHYYTEEVLLPLDSSEFLGKAIKV